MSYSGFCCTKRSYKSLSTCKTFISRRWSYKSELERAVKENILENHVLFLGYQKNVDIYYQIADITLLTSKTESFPLVLLESARECTPAITTDVGGVKKMIPDASFGFIVEVDNVRRNYFMRLKLGNRVKRK